MNRPAKLVCDLREVTLEEGSWADSDARLDLETLMHKYFGKEVCITITEMPDLSPHQN